MKKIETDYKIGEYQLGWRMVDLFVMPFETGGWFNCCHNGSPAQMHIGLNYDAMYKVHQVVVHEAHELAMCDQGCSFKRNDAYVDNASDCYQFIMDHNQFTEVCARAGFFLYNTLNPLTAEWRKYRKLNSKG